MNEKPNYYAVIPSYVRYDSELKPNTKLMFGEITALASKNGYCNARNDYFASLYNVHKITISKWISQLKEKGYIGIEIIYKKDTKEIKERRLIVNGIPISEKINTYKQNDLYPISEKAKDNNTSINNIKNNISNDILSKDFYKNKELNSLFLEFLKLRKSLKAVNSDRAIKLLLKDLEKYDDATKIKMIEQSIKNSWKSIYELKENKNGKQSLTEKYKDW